MMEPSPQSAADLPSLIDRASRRWRCVMTVRTGLALATGVLLAMLALVLLDAAQPWPAGARLLAIVGFGVTIAGGAIAWGWRWRHGPGQAGLARRFEQACGLSTNVFINAVQLRPRLAAIQIGQATRPSLEPGLIQRAIHQADEHAGQLQPAQAIDLRGVRHRAAWLAVVLAAWLVTALIQPALITAGLPRLALPLGDHPPFSLTRLTVEVQPQPAPFGGDAIVQVTASGRPVMDAALVEVDASRREVRRWAMRSVDEQVFTRELRSLREPVRYRVEAGTAISRTFLVEVEPAPVSDPSEDAVAPPQETDATATVDDANGQVIHGREARRDVELTGLRQRLEEMIRQLAQMQRLAEQLQASPDDPDMAAAMAELQAMLRQLLADADAILDEALPSVSADAHAALADALQAIEQQLASLALRNLPAASAADMPDQWQRWPEQIAHASQADAQAMRGLARQLDEVRHGRVAFGMTAEDDIEQTMADTPYDQRIERGTVETDPGRARVEQAPAEYRELVVRYFRRLATDERSRSTTQE